MTRWNRFIAWIDAILEEYEHGDYTEPATPLFITQPLMPETKANKLYDLSKSLLGQHLTLNESVPWMVGCAEAVSKLLVQFGISNVPQEGIEGTVALAAFLASSRQFQEIYTYTHGAVLVAPTGTGNGKIRGHTGVCGDSAIMSNNSETGNWDTQWDIARWKAYYEEYGGIHTRYFLPV